MRRVLKAFLYSALFLVNTLRLEVLILRTGSRERLFSLKGKHKNERIFVLGAGPSLKDVRLEKLEGGIVVCTHFSFKAIDSINTAATYWVVGAESRMPDLAEVDRKKFTESVWQPGSVRRRNYPFYAFKKSDIIPSPAYDKDAFFLSHKRRFLTPFHKQGNVEELISQRAPIGLSCIFTGIQLAYLLGAREIVLLGADFGAGGGSGNAAYFDECVPVVDRIFKSGGDPYNDRYPLHIRPALCWYRAFLQAYKIRLVNGSPQTRDDVLENVSGEWTR